jgi:broad specificity phosphatase PhoE
LNEHGRQQTSALAKYIRNIGVSALYSSDLRRAVETANLLSDRLGYAPILDARWRERDIGKWQGMTLDEIRTWHEDEYKKLQDDVAGYRVPDGESRNDVKRRVLEAFNDVLIDDRGSTVGVISHTTATHMLLEALIPGYDVYGVVLGNSSVTTIARDDDTDWRIVTANDLSHLEGLTSDSVGELEGKR